MISVISGTLEQIYRQGSVTPSLWGRLGKTFRHNKQNLVNLLSCCSWVAHCGDFRRTASHLHWDCVLLVTLHSIRLEILYAQRKIHVSYPRPPSARIHISETLQIEPTFRGHLSISGRWKDTFQPRDVVHLCYTVAGIKQHQQHGWRPQMLITTIYSTDESRPITTCTSTVALLEPRWRRAIKTVFKGPRGYDMKESQSHQKGL